MWLVAAHRECTVESGSVSLADRCGLRRCHTLLRVSRYKRRVHHAFKSTTAHYTHAPPTHRHRHRQSNSSICHVLQRELVLHRTHLPLPAHDHDRRKALFSNGDLRGSGSTSAHSTTATTTGHCTTIYTGSVYYRVLPRLHVLK